MHEKLSSYNRVRICGSVYCIVIACFKMKNMNQSLNGCPPKVKYSIKAVLEKDDVSIGQEAVQPFLIHSTPEQTETQRKQDITEQIKTFGCFPRGYITVSVRIDKDCYRHDDVLGLTLEVSYIKYSLVFQNLLSTFRNWA